MAKINPENLQRLVDGELDLDQTRQVLIDAEKDPANWREIACAMVEDQVFQKQFSLVASSSSGIGLSDEKDVVTDESKESQISPISTSTVKLNQGKSDQNDATTRYAIPLQLQLQHLALAAGLLIALTTGFLVGSSRLPSFDSVATNADSEPAEKNTNEDWNQPVRQLAADDAVSSDRISPASYVQFETPDGGAPEGQVPLFRPKDFQYLTGQDRTKEFDPQTLGKLLPELGVTDELRTQLGRSGYQLDIQVDFVSGNFSDGRKFVVPLRTIRWSPGN